VSGDHGVPTSVASAVRNNTCLCRPAGSRDYFAGEGARFYAAEAMAPVSVGVWEFFLADILYSRGGGYPLTVCTLLAARLDWKAPVAR